MQRILIHLLMKISFSHNIFKLEIKRIHFLIINIVNNCAIIYIQCHNNGFLFLYYPYVSYVIKIQYKKYNTFFVNYLI